MYFMKHRCFSAEKSKETLSIEAPSRTRIGTLVSKAYRRTAITNPAYKVPLRKKGMSDANVENSVNPTNQRYMHFVDFLHMS